MKFDFCIGNPPYQNTVREASEGNNKNTVDVFPFFQEAALKISKANCLIYPAKEYQRGKKDLMDNHLFRLRIYNGSAKEAEKSIPGEDSIFGNSVRRIPGDVGVFYWDTEKTSNKIIYQDMEIDRTKLILPVRKDLIDIAYKLSKYADSFHLSSITKACESNFVQYNPEDVLGEVKNRNKPAPEGYTKVLTNDKAGSGGKAKWYYIKTTSLDRLQPERYKVITSSAYPNEAFKNQNNIEIINKDEMFGRSKLAIYDSDNYDIACSFRKFMSTKFVKLIVMMTPFKFLYYLPNFDLIYDEIDWKANLDNIDNQLYRMCSFSESEINFVNTLI